MSTGVFVKLRGMYPFPKSYAFVHHMIDAFQESEELTARIWTESDFVGSSGTLETIDFEQIEKEVPKDEVLHFKKKFDGIMP